MRECPFCFTPVGVEETQCPRCGRRIDVFRTGFHSRPTLPPGRRAAVWAVAAALVAILVAGLVRSCRASGAGSTAQNLQLP